MVGNTQQNNDGNHQAFKKTGLAYVLIIATLLVTIVLVPKLFGKNESKNTHNVSQIRVFSVTTFPIEEQQSYQRIRSYLGTVEPKRTSHLGFEMAGMIKAIHIREGESVEKGQLLAELDTDRLEAAKKEAEAQFLEAEASLRLAEATLKRTRHAQKLKAVSSQQLDEARTNLESQRARVVRVKAQVDRIDVDLKKSKLFAPYSGSLASRRSDEGTVIAQGQPILEIMETAETEIRIGFDRDASAQLTIGSIVHAKTRDQQFTLQIERILPGREKMTRVVQAIATPTLPSTQLREADLVDVTMKQSITQPGYWLPVSSLTENTRGLWSCLVASPIVSDSNSSEATHQLMRKDLEILSLEEERVYVTGNLQSGDQVVLDGVHRVVPQQRVQIKQRTLQVDTELALNK